MDIALQAGAATPLIDGPRPITEPSVVPGATPHGADGTTAIPLSQLFGPPPIEDTAITGAIDKIRSDFEAFRVRLDQQRDAGLSAGTSTHARQDPVAQLSASMDRAVRTQVDILEFGIALNAGLTASQQSQNSVKTLLEKS